MLFKNEPETVTQIAVFLVLVGLLTLGAAVAFAPAVSLYIVRQLLGVPVWVGLDSLVIAWAALVLAVEAVLLTLFLKG